ncbi:unnamed protein product [Linum trigynum]|uniref:Uncharacterized protein n=1 Tax=Linum trigynum TaxID=586398 RepID=A0AAV2FYY6_9ROSI
MALMEDNHETELLNTVEAAKATFLESDEFKEADEAKYKKLLRDNVASIRHCIRRVYPRFVWDTNDIWDVVEFCSNNDVNSELSPLPTGNTGVEVDQPPAADDGSA